MPIIGQKSSHTAALLYAVAEADDTSKDMLPSVNP
jgi:hypothetical protein